MAQSNLATKQKPLSSSQKTSTKESPYYYQPLIFLRGLAFGTPWVLYLFFVDLLLSLLLIPSALFPNTVYDIGSSLAWSVWIIFQRIFTYGNSATLMTTGDSIRPLESAIVVANHVSWTDVCMIQECSIKAGMLGRNRWFAKEQLKWVPFLGWGIWAMGMPMVSRKWTQDQAEMGRVFGGITKNRWPTCKSTIHPNATYAQVLT
jgi:1-acyl-sn-glycerol-3-phosphate acyltransferase